VVCEVIPQRSTRFKRHAKIKHQSFEEGDVICLRCVSGVHVAESGCNIVVCIKRHWKPIAGSGEMAVEESAPFAIIVGLKPRAVPAASAPVKLTVKRRTRGGGCGMLEGQR
jgi:hypothetical protein